MLFRVRILVLRSIKVNIDINCSDYPYLMSILSINALFVIFSVDSSINWYFAFDYLMLALDEYFINFDCQSIVKQRENFYARYMYSNLRILKFYVNFFTIYYLLSLSNKLYRKVMNLKDDLLLLYLLTKPVSQHSFANPSYLK
jgi:hypothetical protein